MLRLYCSRLLQAAVAQQGVGGGSLATELLVQLHGILGVACLEQGTIPVGSCLVEATSLLKCKVAVGLSTCDHR